MRILVYIFHWETNGTRKMYAKIKDLPVPDFAKPLSRRIYSVFWWPFYACWSFWETYRSFLVKGFCIAVFLGLAFSCFMYYIGALTASIAVGLAVVTFIAGLGITALLTLISALG
jgi:hypothetical protein